MSTSRSSASPRLRWIVDQLDVGRADDVLEVGGGHGVAASLILDRLDTGRFVGLDRSATMTTAAAKRNERAASDGRAEFLVGAVGTFNFGGRRFDRILAARVADLTGAEGLTWAAGLLTAPGRIVLGFDAPDDSTPRAAAEATIDHLPRAGLRLVEVRDARLDGSLVICVHAAPTDRER